MVDILLSGRLIWVFSNLYFDRLLTRSLSLLDLSPPPKCRDPKGQNFADREREISIWSSCRKGQKKADLGPIMAKGWIGVEEGFGGSCGSLYEDLVRDEADWRRSGVEQLSIRQSDASAESK